MKRFSVFLAVLLLLVCMVPCAYASGSASLIGPDKVRAGDTITLTFYAGGDNILGGSGSMSYDSSQLTLQGYSAAIGGSWVVEFGGNNFVFYDNSMASPINGSTAIFRATFKVSDSLPEGTVITVTASGVTVSDGQSDMGVGSRSYSTTVLPPLSDNCRLASLSVTNATISPAFSADVTNYSASVLYTTSSLSLTATAEHAGASVAVSSTQLAAGGTTGVTVTVTAENGTTKVYTISVARAQDPNYVPSSNAKLSSLSVDGFILSPQFQDGTTRYYVWLPYETETVTIHASAADSKATVSVGEVGELTPGKAKDVSVTVTAEDKTQQVYTVTVFRAPAHADTDAFLGGARETEPVPAETTVPETTAEPTEPSATAAPEPVARTEVRSPNWLVPALVLTALGSALLGAAAAWIIRVLVKKKK